MNKNPYLIPGSIVLAGIIIAFAVFNTGAPKAPKQEEQQQQQQQQVAGAATVDDDAILGDVNAPVTWIEFGDYECPFCGKLYSEVTKRIKDEYVATGKVRMVYRDFPLSFHAQAIPAAEAAECAGDQGKYWTYHDALFDRQAQLASLDYTALAGELGLNTESFKACVDARTHKAEVEADFQDGVAAGVEGTPGVFINGVLVAGAYPYETFQQLIDQTLAELEN